MSNETNPDEYQFDAKDDIYINDVVGQVLSEIECEPDCISEELQILRDTYRQSIQLSYFEIVASSIRRLRIQTTDPSEERTYDYISSSASGIIVRNQGTNRYALIRGTAYCLPIERYGLKEVNSTLNSYFPLDSNVKLTIEDFSSKVPVIACRSTIGQFGYLVTSNIINSSEEGRGRISNRIDISTAPIQVINTDL